MNGYADPYEGQWLYKVGMKTGRGYGEVLYDCFTTTNVDEDWRMPCSVIVSDTVDYGDSGGPVFFTYGSGIKAAGILFGVNTAHDAYATSRISAVLNDLGEYYPGSVCIVIGCSPDPQVTISGPTYLPPGLSCQWTTSSSSGVPPYSHAWSGVLSGSGPTKTGIVYSSGWLTVTITDDVGNYSSNSTYLTVSSSAPAPPGCSE